MYQAVIEIPKGDTRRRHKRQGGEELVDFGPITIPINGGVMPIHYGYIIGTLNTEESPAEELDVLIFSDKKLAPADRLEIRPIALLMREDNNHKVVATDDTNSREWTDIGEEERKLLLDYFSYNYKIVKIASGEEAIKLIEKSS